MAKRTIDLGLVQGSGIASIVLTSQEGLVDTYTITMQDGTTSTFTVTNGEKGDAGDTITSVSKNHSEGLVDYYDVNLSSGSKLENAFFVTNGSGAVNTVNENYFKLIGSNLDLAEEFVELVNEKADSSNVYTKTETNSLLSSRANENIVGDAWNSITDYVVGDYSIDNNLLWKALGDNTNKRPSQNPSFWEQVNVADEISKMNEDLSITQATFTANPAYISSVSFEFKYIKAFKMAIAIGYIAVANAVPAGQTLVTFDSLYNGSGKYQFLLAHSNAATARLKIALGSGTRNIIINDGNTEMPKGNYGIVGILFLEQ